jgi:hypothetical protein
MDIGLALFVYKRPQHTYKVMQSIVRNSFDRIYIFQDGLRNESDREDWEQVSCLIERFRKNTRGYVEIHISEVNKGLADSIVFGIEYVLQRHRTVIALEDDVVLSKDYRRFANMSFEKYEDVSRVMSICGAGACDAVVSDEEYMLSYPFDVYFTHTGSSVAFGTWRDRWKCYKRGREYAASILRDPLKCNRIKDYGGEWLVNLLKSVTQTPDKIDTWATFWAVAEILEDGVSVIPVKALARDIGRDGSGTNTRERTTKFDVQLHDMPLDFHLPSNEDIFVDPYLVARQNIAITSRAGFVDLKLWLLKMKKRLGIEIL